MAICIPTFTGNIYHQHHFALKLRELHLQRNIFKKRFFFMWLKYHIGNL